MPNKIILFLALIFFPLLAVGQGQVDLARNEWMKGYVKLESADKADEAGSQLMALQLYRDAMTAFETVRRKYPDWNPSLLNYRINYCKQKITAIEAEMKDDAQSMSRERLLELTSRQTQIIHDNSLKIQQLTTSVSVLSESLQRARAEAAQKSASDSEFSSLQAARRELEGRCQLLQNKLNKAEEDFAKVKSQSEDRDLSRKLRSELSQQQERLKEASRQMDSLRGDLKSAREDLARKTQEVVNLSRLKQEYETRLENASKRVAELTVLVNDFNQKHQALTLKSEQQAVESKMIRESVTRLEEEKALQQIEIRQLQAVRDKFAATQDANRKLTLQIADYENRLQESAEILNFASRNAAQQQELLQVEIESGRKNLQSAQNRIQEQSAQAEAMAQENQRLNQQLAAATAEAEKLQNETMRLQPRLAEQDSQDKSSASRPDLAPRPENLTQQLQAEQEKTAQLTTLTQQLREESEKIPQLGLDLRTARAELQASEQNLHQAKMQTQNLETQLKQLREAQNALAKRPDQTPQLEALTQQLQTERNKTTQLGADLRAAQNDLREFGQNLKQSQNYALTLEAQLKQLRETQSAFTDIVSQIQGKDELLNNRSAEIKSQAERLASANATILAKTDELNSTQTELQALKRKMSTLEKVNARLVEQVTNFTRRQGEVEKISLSWQQQLAEHTQRQQTLQEQLQAAQAEINAKNQLTINLEKSVTGNEQQIRLLEKRLAEENQKLRLAQEQLESNKTKTAAVDGLTNNLLDLQNTLAAQKKEVDTLQTEQQARQTQLAVLTEQLRRKDEQLKELLASNTANSERIWMARLAELNAKLENEENRRKALEVTLIQKESESRTTPVLPAPLEKAAVSPAVQAGKLLAEQEVLVNGFLRQALDAERNEKIEAAQGDYQDALELQRDNVIALKRLGLLASNSGNYEDTVKYLKLAFRYDSDDLEMLMALGFAMLNLGQTEWAFSYLGRAVALAPDNADTARLFGGALVDLGWTQAAEKQFRRTLEINPRDAYSAFNLAVLCLTDTPQRPGEARKWYEQAVANGAEKDPKFEAAFQSRQ